MLMAHPAVLQNLLKRHDTLALRARSDTADPDIHRQLRDTAYTLCISTGTRDIETALVAAREQTRLICADSSAPAAAV